MPKYDSNWFHEEICAELQQFYDDAMNGKSPKLMIFAPPRHGKTEMVSRRFPAWCFGKNPDMNIIACSYAADLASKNNRDVQRILDDPIYSDVFPDTFLYGKHVRTMSATPLRNNDIFEIVNHNGSYRGAGVGGGITGMGFDIGIIDDPVKDAAEARSQTVRDSVWEWYNSTFLTRSSEKSGVLLIMTRWHIDDLAGRILEHEADKWKIISYPAIAEHNEKYRNAGDPLHPERYPLKFLEERRQSLSTTGYWDALYQQKPVLDGGNLFDFDWFTIASRDEMPMEEDYDYRFITADTAYTEKQSSDYTVFTYFGVKDEKLYLIDMMRKQINSIDVAEWIDPWVMSKIGYKFRYLWIEPMGHGIYLNQYFSKKRVPVPSKDELKRVIGDKGLNVLNRRGDKVIRANNVIPRIDKSDPNVIINKDIADFEAFRSEMVAFPQTGANMHDDIVDTFIDACAIAFANRDFKFEMEALLG